MNNFQLDTNLWVLNTRKSSHNFIISFQSIDKKATTEEKSEASYWYCCAKEGENQSMWSMRQDFQ